MVKKNRDGQIKKLKFLEAGSLEELERGLNEHLSRGWLVVDLKSNYGEFFASHLAILIQKKFYVQLEKFLSERAVNGGNKNGVSR